MTRTLWSEYGLCAMVMLGLLGACSSTANSKSTATPTTISPITTTPRTTTPRTTTPTADAATVGVPSANGEATAASPPQTASTGTAPTTSSSTDAAGAKYTVTLGGSPVERDITLEAGSAVKIWGRITNGSLTTAHGNENIQFAIAGPDGLAASYLDVGDRARFYSDYDESVVAAFPLPVEFMTLAEHHDYIDLWPDADTSPNNNEQPRFFAWGGGERGSWMMYIAPVAGTYAVLITGGGQYDVSLAVGNPVAEPTANSSFDNTQRMTDRKWRDIVKGQLPYLFDPTFFPSMDTAFYDDPDPASSTPSKTRRYGPIGLRHAVEGWIATAVLDTSLDFGQIDPSDTVPKTVSTSPP